MYLNHPFVVISLQDDGHLLEMLCPRAQEKSEPSRQPGSPGDVETCRWIQWAILTQSNNPSFPIVWNAIQWSNAAFGCFHPFLNTPQFCKPEKNQVGGAIAAVRAGAVAAVRDGAVDLAGRAEVKHQWWWSTRIIDLQPKIGVLDIWPFRVAFSRNFFGIVHIPEYRTHLLSKDILNF